ncbi:MAG TPA: response regulator transcription factor [Hanamia sp.]|nr:response regulator transcription factor [Hanamia sp.]
MAELLLVDDHSIVRAGLRLLIEDFLPHTHIDEATDGDSAFRKIKDHHYDLIIMDVNMPNTDSLGTLQSILSFKPSARIIMFSMNSEDVYAKRYLKMGAMGYLRKDAQNEEIKKAISTVLNNKRYISPELNQKLLTELHSNSRSENPFDNLSPREFEIVQHLAHGDSVAEISNKLNLHTSTVGTHKARIFEKLKCNNIIELTNLAKVNGVVL